jgi:hypothetical protein
MPLPSGLRYVIEAMNKKNVVIYLTLKMYVRYYSKISVDFKGDIRRYMTASVV